MVQAESQAVRVWAMVLDSMRQTPSFHRMQSSTAWRDPSQGFNIMNWSESFGYEGLRGLAF